MSRAVVTVKNIQGVGDLFELTEAIERPTVDPTLRPLECRPDEPEFVDLRTHPNGGARTRQAGARLFQALTSEAAVSEQIVLAIAHDRPLYIADQSHLAQSLPWEALCRDADDRFLGLAGTPLGRMVGRLESEPLGRYLYDPPLRVLAVLAASGGAAGDSAIEEWQAIAGSLSGQDAIDFDLRVVGCDDDVRAAVEAAGLSQDPAAAFRFMTSQETLLDEVSAFRPHVLHFFCHGFVEPEPSLELATRSDQARRLERGSVVLTREAFKELRREDPTLWLVALNCCLGAATADSSQPLARHIVREGVPAVVAMQEPIDRRDAHTFCGRFYTSFLVRLAAALNGGAPPFSLEWSELLADPRQRLLQRHVAEHGSAADCKEWTLPVVYVHSEPFSLQGRVAAGLDPHRVAEIQAEIDELEEIRARMSRQLPEVIEGIGKRIAELQQELLGGDGNGD